MTTGDPLPWWIKWPGYEQSPPLSWSVPTLSRLDLLSLGFMQKLLFEPDPLRKQMTTEEAAKAAAKAARALIQAIDYPEMPDG